MTLALIFRSSNVSITVSASDSAVSTESLSRTVSLSRTGQGKLYPSSELYPSLVQLPGLMASDSSYSEDIPSQNASHQIRSSNDAIEILDGSSSFISSERVSSDNTLSSDTNTRSLVQARSTTDISVAGDTVVLIQSLNKINSDTSTTSDSNERVLRFERSVNDQSSLSDLTPELTIGLLRAPGDNSVTADLPTRVVSFVRSTGENPLEPSNLTLPGIIYPGNQTIERSSTTDLGSRIITFPRGTNDESLSNDIDTRSAIKFVRSSSDSSTSTDTVIRSNLNFIRSTLDINTTLDIAQRSSMIFTRTVADALTISEKNVVKWTVFRSAKDTSEFLTSNPTAKVSRVMGYLIWDEGASNILQPHTGKILGKEPINELEIFEGEIFPRSIDPDAFSYQLTRYPITVNKPRQTTTV